MKLDWLKESLTTSPLAPLRWTGILASLLIVYVIVMFPRSSTLAVAPSIAVPPPVSPMPPVAASTLVKPGGISVSGNVQFFDSVISGGACEGGEKIVEVPNGFRGSLGAPGAVTCVCVKVPPNTPITFVPLLKGEINMLGPCEGR